MERKENTTSPQGIWQAFVLRNLAESVTRVYSLLILKAGISWPTSILQITTQGFVMMRNRLTRSANIQENPVCVLTLVINCVDFYHTLIYSQIWQFYV